MIGRIKGILLDKQTSQILVDVNGVAYEIEVPLNTLFQLPALGEEVILSTHFVVREDAQLLYGFFELKERTLFRILIKINGVGPKMAIAILSSMNANELVRHVHNNDVDALVKIPGVGKKTAERLIIELRDKLKDWELDSNSATGIQGTTGQMHSSSIHDAEAALVSLGYKPKDADKAVSSAVKALEQEKQEVSSEALIRLALKNIT